MEEVGWHYVADEVALAIRPGLSEPERGGGVNLLHVAVKEIPLLFPIWRIFETCILFPLLS